MFWYFAHSFGWTPEQVLKLPSDRLVYMKELEEYAKKLERDAIKK